MLLLISVGVFCFNLILTLPIELEAMEYGVSGDELKQLKSEHKELADSDFIDFVESYLKFGLPNVTKFVEARKLNIANYNDLLKHKEAVKQIEREKTIALEAEKKRIAEAEKKRIADAERQSTSTTSSEPKPADVDMFCSGLLFRASGLINSGLSPYRGEALNQLKQLSTHLERSANLLMQRGVVSNGSADSANAGVSVANNVIGKNINGLIQSGSDPHKSVMGCLKRLQ